MNALRNVRTSKELKVGRELLGRNMMRTRRSEPETLGWQKVMFTSVVMQHVDWGFGPMQGKD